MADAWDFGPGNYEDAGVNYAWESGLSGGATSGANDNGWISGLGDVFNYGLKRSFDAAADVYRMENAQPQLIYDQYGRAIDPRAAMAPMQQSGGISPVLLLIAGVVAVVVLAD